MDPIFLGRTHCFDVEKQCVLGEDNTYRLQRNQKLKQAFDQSCNEKQGSQIRCCPLSLINKPYNPPQNSNLIPIHIKFKNGEYDVCPEEIRSQCFREKPEEKGLCISQKCNDAGYLEPENYYQICKSYKDKEKGERIPDCSTNNCEQMMTLPVWFQQELAQL